VNAGAWTSPRRWRAAADAVALALGINVWISLVLLPGLFVGAWSGQGSVAIAILPLAALMAGVLLRSELALLLLFPSALMVPVAMAPSMVSMHVYGPVRFTIVAASVVAYLLGVSFFTSFHEPPPPVGQRPLASSSQPIPERWRRRFRIYWMLTALSVVFPLTFVYSVNFDDDSRTFLGEMYPGRTAQMSTLLNLLAIGVWLVYAYGFHGVLRRHRTGDRELVADLGNLRAGASRARPRPVFYLSVACALGLMGILVASRYL
jgi:hypothetical protein